MSDPSDWVPPVAPDPTKIGQEARLDQREGRYAVALAKRLWYHRHALEFEPRLGPVRLSFGLGYWHHLAKIYPPAMAAMLAERDNAQAKLLKGPVDFDTFREFSAFNERLGDLELTVQVFERIRAVDPAVAKLLYLVAEPALIAAKRFELCGAFLDPDRRLKFARDAYEAGLRFEAERLENAQGVQPPPTARRLYVRNVGTMLALLSHNSRWEEAERYAEEAVKDLDDPDSAREIFGKAVYGEFPPDR